MIKIAPIAAEIIAELKRKIFLQRGIILVQAVVLLIIVANHFKG